MTVAAAVLTRNQFDHERRDLFDQTIDSLHGQVDELHVFDNGSTDGTTKLVEKATDWIPHLNSAINTTSGFGTWTCCRILAGTNADLCIVSDDDMVWQSGAVDALGAWWHEVPDKVTITGCHLEPEYFWNEITGHVEYGGLKGLVRASTGAASWTFHRKHYDRLAQVAAKLPINRQGHWDVPMCNGIRANEWQIAQVDLAEHIGQGRSSWGNRTEDLYGWNVASVKAAL